MTNFAKEFLLLSFCISIFISCSSTKTQIKDALDPAVSKDFADYHNLRLVKGHFQGDNWNADVDDWNGKKHQLMTRLADYAVAHDWDSVEVRQYFGEPDEQVFPESVMFDQVVRHGQNKKLLQSGNEFIFYHWRGTHDFLIFVLKDQQVQGFDWWYPRE